ncbi:MAG: FIG003003: hypothetical protein [uncultured Phycisphaerae bacterium]|uniref:DUF72 domain-containing protein n=1 Tax=uncultured Phycisphaerae bacterium TaxID=904963 RepID=A0A6J4PNC0_9BACT|nr:MAG: FIG003003: hypothetical protein [uncultured Phycisphaerae bacterium]
MTPPRRNGRPPQTRVGISGWTYGPWRGVFYPAGLPHKHELAHASRQFNSIEINGTFYSLQRPSSFAAWHAQTPDDFVFAVKGGRFITHMKKLAGVETALANFFASGVLLLREKLGPILWQLPPMLRFDPDRLANFFDLLPRDTTAAAKLATRHDERLKGHSHVEADRKRPIRYALEVRHASFKTPEFVALLRKHDVALVLADTAQRWPYMEDVTSDFVYARLHGDTELYASGYSDAALDWWAERLRLWREGCEPTAGERASDKAARKCKARDVFVYFDNDAKVRAPFDAANLALRLGVRESGEPLALPDLAGAGEAPRESWPTLRRGERPPRPRSPHP